VNPETPILSPSLTIATMVSISVTLLWYFALAIRPAMSFSFDA